MEIMDRLHFPKTISTLMKDMYANLVRRFKFNGFLREPVSSDGLRGALQGSAFSMVAMNIAAIAWFCAVRNGVSTNALRLVQHSVQQVFGADLDWNQVQTGLTSRGQDNVRQGGCADDLHVASCSAAGVTRAHWLTLLWASALCMKLNPSKSFRLGNIQLKIGNQTLQCVQDTKILGNIVDFRQEDFNNVLHMPDSRVPSARRVWLGFPDCRVRSRIV